MTRILAVAGSLAARSSNAALLGAAMLASPPGLSVEVYDGLGALPPFNPDVEASGALPGTVADLRARVDIADALLFSVPEYAHGVPGAFKNLLDWLVGGPEFVDKPVALWNASPRATHAQASLREIVATMSGRLVEPASLEVHLLGRDAETVLAEPGVAGRLAAALGALAAYPAAAR